MAKLSDSQLVLLSTAAGRPDGAFLPPPKSLKLQGGALTATLKKLIKTGLAAEQPAAAEALAWREDTDGRRLMLVLTPAGLETLDSGSGASKTPKTAKARSKASTAKGSGAKAKGSSTRTKASERTAAQKPAKVRSAKTGRAKGNISTRIGTKQALLIRLLQRKGGATIAEIAEATGWQAHSVRGVISGTLKKKLGLSVTSETVESRGRMYRIEE